MPLYEYQCESCGRRIERIRKFSDPPLTACPECGGLLHKLVSSPAFHLKGSGWYATDYARKPEAAKSADSGGGAEAKDAKDRKDTSGDAAQKSTDSAAAKEAGGKDAGSKDAGSKDAPAPSTPASSTTGKT